MHDFRNDLDAFKEIAVEAHSRHSRESISPYIASQSVVESGAHKRIAELNARHQRVLEIGIGGGEHLVFEQPLEQRDCYIGLDIEPDFLAICRDAFGIPVLMANAARLPFPDGSFDCVVASSVLEHLERLDETLAEIRRVLSPGGRLLVTVPTNGSLIIALYKLVMTYPYLRFRGVKRPGVIWHYLNVNCLKRVEALLHKHFKDVRRESSPWSLLPWHLSPLCIFECRAL